MSEHAAILFANEAFYRAFADQDIDAMIEMWSSSAAISCIHPGWAPLYGPDAVIESWVSILGGPHAPRVEVLQPKVQHYGNTATVICYEKIDDNFLIATNLFVREGKQWRLVHHQAGPVPEPDQNLNDNPIATIN